MSLLIRVSHPPSICIIEKALWNRFLAKPTLYGRSARNIPFPNSTMPSPSTLTLSLLLSLTLILSLIPILTQTLSLPTLPPLLSLSNLTSLPPPPPLNTTTTSPSAENPALVIQCSGEHFGYNPIITDCESAKEHISPDTVAYTWGPRHAGLGPAVLPLPYRIMGGELLHRARFFTQSREGVKGSE